MTDELVTLQLLGIGTRFRLPGTELVYTLRGIATDRRNRREMRVYVEEDARPLVLGRNVQVEIVSSR